MIQKNELRISNQVLFAEDSTIFIVESIDETGCNLINEIESTWIEHENLCGIPLTEEILLKCGFEKQDYNMSNCHVYQKGIYRVLKSFNNDNINQDYSLCINGISPPTWSIAHFKHLHQLQNIYFALTNTELKINKMIS